jgi:hypothetical protein
MARMPWEQWLGIAHDLDWEFSYVDYGAGVPRVDVGAG